MVAEAKQSSDSSLVPEACRSPWPSCSQRCPRDGRARTPSVSQAQSGTAGGVSQVKQEEALLRPPEIFLAFELALTQAKRQEEDGGEKNMALKI